MPPSSAQPSVVEGGQDQVATDPRQVAGDEQSGSVQGGDPSSYLQDLGDRHQPADQAQYRRVDLGRGVVAAAGTVDPDHRALTTRLGQERLAGPATGQGRQLGEVHAPTLPYAQGAHGTGDRALSRQRRRSLTS